MPKMFHVEQNWCRAYFCGRKSSIGRPIRMNRRCESGICTAGCQVHPEVLAILVESSDPTHRTRCPRRARAPVDQRRSCLNSPTARQVMTSARMDSGRICSNRSQRISTSVNFKDLTTSLKNAHFFLLDSINVTFVSGLAILIARPGKPAPVPMSTSRQFFMGNIFEAYMDSPKWRPTMSIESVIAVKLIDWFHFSKSEMYSRIM